MAVIIKIFRQVFLLVAVFGFLCGCSHKREIGVIPAGNNRSFSFPVDLSSNIPGWRFGLAYATNINAGSSAADLQVTLRIKNSVEKQIIATVNERGIKIPQGQTSVIFSGGFNEISHWSQAGLFSVMGDRGTAVSFSLEVEFEKGTIISRPISFYAFTLDGL